MKLFILKLLVQLKLLGVEAARIAWRLIVWLVNILYLLIIQLSKGLWWLIVNIMRISYINFNKRHRHRLSDGTNVLRLIISIIIFFFFSQALLESDWRLGLSYVFSGFIAIWFGYIYRNEVVMGLVLVGVVIGSLVTVLAPQAWKAFSAGDYIGAAVIVFLMIFFFSISREYKKGRRPKL